MMHSSLSNSHLRRFARLLPVALIAVFALSLSGCNKDIQKVEAKEGGRIYLANLFYQVQLSRILNPKDIEDRYYLVGQPAPAKGEAYFGVFMRVDNETNPTRVMPIGIKDMKIKNASGTVYTPIPSRAAAGWSYEPVPLGKGASLPLPDSPAGIGPIRGSMILFKIPYTGLDSRPLILYVKSPDGKIGQVTLDV
jgi:hypothetical protein